jgi:ABC-type glycerol-3-phosphate transport system permease component
MKTNRLHRGIRIAAVVFFAVLTVLPLLLMVSRSFMSPAEIYAQPPRLLPRELSFDNYAEALQYLTPRAVLNSFIFTIGIVLLQLALSMPAAFALAKIRFRWTAVVLALLIAPMFVPSTFSLIPLFVEVYQLGWLNTYAGMIVPMAASISFAVLLFRQFFAGLPDGLVEAARMDGAGWLRVFWSVFVPLSGPVVATYASVSFLTAWNMYIWPLVIATDPDLTVINVALAPLAGGVYATSSPAVALAGGVIALLPVLAVFLGFQRFYVKGVVGTGLE